ncbi:protein ANTAGONIST OF LIKE HETEROCHROMATIN PROTEIN 1 [Elysia marginata]|uniref:Protein ANTAGONIST OF LIKE HETEROCHROMATIN PROTEIN 1 n=1 Tax=Elysia marginata TaxID=1093978 RepID=A0AAV4FK92_9GAST|nr:protein ANTAGONIST OF LIKE HETEROCHROMATIN PROTEIN 1 [Elysia marginata]
MGASTIGAIVTETVDILWAELHTQHMPEPTADAFKKIAAEFFETWNFPHCVGAIDGKHVRVKCPANSGSMFFNYKNYFSIVLQAAVDAKYKFIAIDVGGYGKQSDGGTFQASRLYQALMDKTLKLPDPAPLPQSDVMAPYVFVADEAYPLLTFIMKPYGGGNLPLSHECFNKRLSRCRKVVECAFGILNSKWSILSKCIDTRADLADNIIKCLCILHNTIIDREGVVQNLTEVSFPRSDVAWELAGRPTNNAKGVRDIFTSYFAQNPLVYT